MNECTLCDIGGTLDRGSLAGSLCDSLSKLAVTAIKYLLHFWFDSKNDVGIYLGSNS